MQSESLTTSETVPAVMDTEQSLITTIRKRNAEAVMGLAQISNTEISPEHSHRLSSIVSKKTSMSERNVYKGWLDSKWQLFTLDNIKEIDGKTLDDICFWADDQHAERVRLLEDLYSDENWLYSKIDDVWFNAKNWPHNNS